MGECCNACVTPVAFNRLILLWAYHPALFFPLLSRTCYPLSRAVKAQLEGDRNSTVKWIPIAEKIASLPGCEATTRDRCSSRFIALRAAYYESGTCYFRGMVPSDPLCRRATELMGAIVKLQSDEVRLVALSN